MRFGYRVTYRSWQFWKVIIARPLSRKNLEEVAMFLNGEQMALFQRQSLAGQQHGYRVMRTLMENGQENKELLQAALLHDVGKIRLQTSWWDRPLVVLAQRLFPDRVKAWGNGDVSSWRRPFVIKARHPEWGAEYAEHAGCTPSTVELIRRHQDPAVMDAAAKEDEQLTMLQWADDRS